MLRVSALSFMLHHVLCSMQTASALTSNEKVPNLLSYFVRMPIFCQPRKQCAFCLRTRRCRAQQESVLSIMEGRWPGQKRSDV